MKNSTTVSVCRALGKKFDANVIIKGSKAYTDGKTVVVPDLGNDLTDEQKTILNGYLDHEAGGHLLFTDFSVTTTDAKLHNFFNLLEDIRVEKLLGDRYPGCKNNLTALRNSLIAKSPLAKCGFNSLWVEGFRVVAGQKIDSEDFTGLAKKVYGDDIFDRLTAMTSSQDAMNLASAIQGELKKKIDEKKAKKAEEEKAKEEAEEIEDQEECSSSSSGISDGEAGGEPNTETDDEKNDDVAQSDGGEAEKFGEREMEFEDDDEGANDEADDEAGDEAGDTDEGAEEKEDDENDMPDMSDEVREGESADGESEGPPSTDEIRSAGSTEDDAEDEIYTEPEDDVTAEELEETLEDLESHDEAKKLREMMEEYHRDVVRSGYAVFSTDKDKVIKVRQAPLTTEYEDLKEGLGNLNVQKHKIAQMFKTRIASKFVGDRERGKINNRSLARIVTGNRRVFKEKYVSQEQDTAVSFLCDFSGSMSGSSIRKAMQASVMLLESLNGLGVKSELLGYTTDRKIPKRSEATDLSVFGRIEGLITYEFKTFNEPLNIAVKKKISSWRSLSLRENCDPCSVRLAHDRLLARPEKRKILFVLTDGVVANCGNVWTGRKELKRLVKEIEKSGIVEIVAIDLHSDTADAYYSNVINVEYGDNLSEKIFEGLRRVMKL